MRFGAPPNNKSCINEAHVLFSLKEVLKMAVQWNKDVDVALTQAKADKKPLLLDFSAAPA
jgi:hypothetical protein